jgi:hypothetical protein
LISCDILTPLTFRYTAIESKMSEGDGEGLGVGVGDGEGEGVIVGLEDGVGVLVRVRVLVREGAGVCDAEAVTLNVAVVVIVTDDEQVPETLGVTELDTVAVVEGEGVLDTVGSGVQYVTTTPVTLVPRATVR